jgi:colicin import membrane protein
MNELLTLDEELKWVEGSKAVQIKAVFLPMFKMLDEMEGQFNIIAGQEITKDLCSKAKRLRLDIAKIRIAADKERKSQKDEYLRAGNAIQGVYNILKFAVTDKEEKLKTIEDHFVNLEKERIAKLEKERMEILEALGESVYPKNLGDMDQPVFDNYIAGVEIARARQKEAEEKARIEKEKEDLRQKRIFQCARISEYIEGFEKIDLAELSEEDYFVLIEKGKTARAEALAEQERVRLENEKAQAEIKRLEDEKKAQAEKEAREKAEALAEQERRKTELEKAGDSGKFDQLSIEIKGLILNYSFETKEYKAKIENLMKIII